MSAVLVHGPSNIQIRSSTTILGRWSKVKVNLPISLAAKMR